MDDDIGEAVIGEAVIGEAVIGEAVIGEAVIGEDDEEGEERMISVIAFLSRGVSTSEMFPFGLTYKTVGTPVTGFSDPIGVF
jgi:hypothetical protein